MQNFILGIELISFKNLHWESTWATYRGRVYTVCASTSTLGLYTGHRHWAYTLYLHSVHWASILRNYTDYNEHLH